MKVKNQNVMSGMSIEQMRAALEERTKMEIESLRTKRTEHETSIRELDRQLETLGVSTRKVSRRGRKPGQKVARSENSQPLREVVHTILAKQPGRTATVKQLTQLVQ